jgi:hypothetical protein
MSVRRIQTSPGKLSPLPSDGGNFPECVFNNFDLDRRDPISGFPLAFTFPFHTCKSISDAILIGDVVAPLKRSCTVLGCVIFAAYGVHEPLIVKLFRPQQ